jgi:hypothetical protein
MIKSLRIAVQPKAISACLIAAAHPNFANNGKTTFRAIDRLLQLIQIPPLYGNGPDFSPVTECQFPRALAQLKCHVQNSPFCAIFFSQGSLSLFHLKPPLVSFWVIKFLAPNGCSRNPA